MFPNLTFQPLAVSLRIIRFNIQKFYMVLALRSVFCSDIGTDSDFCFVHHWFLKPWKEVFTARCGLVPYVQPITFRL